MMRDIVVIGAPIGGAAALTQLIGDLPSDFDASVFVALHTRPENPILLADVLNDQRGPRAAVAVHGEPVIRRRIYVAADDCHLTVHDGRVYLTNDAVNGPRPSIDKLFTGAAKTYANRVIGVVLLHCRNDGALGLQAVRRAGGRTITHDNKEMHEQPKDPKSGEPLSDAHLGLAKIAERVLRYAYGGNCKDWIS
jgi:two-component system, chemotaxis family, protein-glutamate methylesterase/glutaminase